MLSIHTQRIHCRQQTYLNCMHAAPRCGVHECRSLPVKMRIVALVAFSILVIFPSCCLEHQQSRSTPWRFPCSAYGIQQCSGKDISM